MNEIITLSHGSGGSTTQKLISDLFYKYFDNEILRSSDDAAKISICGNRMAFTTDSFVVSPIVFNGGDIGKLAVCGTVNDLTAAGAKPLFLSCGFILEEGFEINELEKIVASMSAACIESGVKIVTGDTKVVQKGACDKIFINTSGVGMIHDGINTSGANAAPGDSVIITGTLGDHGCTIMLDRNMPGLIKGVYSDCAPLNGLIEKIYTVTKDIHVLRDPTRGGVATTLNEIVLQSSVSIQLEETNIPVRNEVAAACELLGLDPLYLANEGKMLVIAPKIYADKILQVLKSDKYGKASAIIGSVIGSDRPRLTLHTLAGGSRILDMMSGDQLPRIC